MLMYIILTLCDEYLPLLLVQKDQDILMAQELEPWQLEPQNIPVGVGLVEESKINTTYYQTKLQTLDDIACRITEDGIDEYIRQKRQLQELLETRIAEKRIELEEEKAQRIRKQKAEIRFGAECTTDELAQYDFMVTTNCPGCGDKCCVRIDRPICYFCVNDYELERSVQ